MASETSAAIARRSSNSGQGVLTGVCFLRLQVAQQPHRRKDDFARRGRRHPQQPDRSAGSARRPRSAKGAAKAKAHQRAPIPSLSAHQQRQSRLRRRAVGMVQEKQKARVPRGDPQTVLVFGEALGDRRRADFAPLRRERARRRRCRETAFLRRRESSPRPDRESSARLRARRLANIRADAPRAPPRRTGNPRPKRVSRASAAAVEGAMLPDAGVRRLVAYDRGEAIDDVSRAKRRRQPEQRRRARRRWTRTSAAARPSTAARSIL